MQCSSRMHAAAQLPLFGFHFPLSSPSIPSPCCRFYCLKWNACSLNYLPLFRFHLPLSSLSPFIPSPRCCTVVFSGMHAASMYLPLVLWTHFSLESLTHGMAHWFPFKHVVPYDSLIANKYNLWCDLAMQPVVTNMRSTFLWYVDSEVLSSWENESQKREHAT